MRGRNLPASGPGRPGRHVAGSRSAQQEASASRAHLDDPRAAVPRRSPVGPRGWTRPEPWWRRDVEPREEIVPEATKTVAPMENRFLPAHLPHPFVRDGASGDRGPVLNLFMNRIVELRVSIVEMRLPPDRVMKARVAAGAEAGD